MSNNELRKNAEGYTDPTAAATLSQKEPGDIWAYNGGACLIIKNHGKFSTILLLESQEKHPNQVKIMTKSGPMYADLRLITYGLHVKMGRYIETVCNEDLDRALDAIEDFKQVIEAVEVALSIQLPRVETTRKEEPKSVARPVNDDPVNRPAHYTSGGIECIDAIRASMTPEEFKGFLKGNTMKYLWRYRLKGNPAQDLEKAGWYLSRLTEAGEG